MKRIPVKRRVPGRVLHFPAPSIKERSIPVCSALPEKGKCSIPENRGAVSALVDFRGFPVYIEQ